MKGTYASLRRCPDCPEVQPLVSPSHQVPPLSVNCSEALISSPCPSSHSNPSSALVTAAAIVGSVATVAVQSLKDRLYRFCQRRRESSAKSSSSVASSKVEGKLMKSKGLKTVAGTQTTVTYKRDGPKFKNIGTEADTYCEFHGLKKC